jgi:hypothetical protein
VDAVVDSIPRNAGHLPNLFEANICTAFDKCDVHRRCVIWSCATLSLTYACISAANLSSDWQCREYRFHLFLASVPCIKDITIVKQQLLCIQVRLERLWHPLMLLTELLLCAPLAIWWTVFARQFRKPPAPSLLRAIEGPSQPDQALETNAQAAGEMHELQTPASRTGISTSGACDKPRCTVRQDSTRGIARLKATHQKRQCLTCPRSFCLTLLVCICFHNIECMANDLVLRWLMLTMQTRQTTDFRVYKQNHTALSS